MRLFQSCFLNKNGRKNGLIGFERLTSFAVLLVLFSFIAIPSVYAEVLHFADAQVEGLPHSHVNLWKDNSREPKGVVIAMHGLIMHGGVYDKMARQLVNQGYIVYAQDMRGYGRWNPSLVKEILASKKDKDGFTTSDLGVSVLSGPADAHLWNKSEELFQRRTEARESEEFLKAHSKVAYSESFKDLLKLTKAVKANHDELPLFIVGESMGAGMALHVASEAPDCVDGLVLSSPAIKKKLNLAPRMLVDLFKVVRHPKSPLNLKPYILRFSSEDPVTAKSCATDPLVRKSLSLPELYRTMKEINRNIKYADKVASDIPVLIIQGDKDRMVKSNGAALLLSHLNCKEQTVKWFEGKGHLLLETPHITDETMTVVQQWLNQQFYDLKTKVSVTSLPGRNID